jgi:hypothetical protein
MRDTLAKSQTPPPTSRLPPLVFALLVFGRFSARGVKKHHTNIFAKSPCRKLFPKKTTKISMSVFPRLFVLFYRSFRRFSAMGVQKHKKIVSKSLKKNSTKIQNRFVLDLFYHVFGRFSVRKVQTH